MPLKDDLRSLEPHHLDTRLAFDGKQRPVRDLTMLRQCDAANDFLPYHATTYGHLERALTDHLNELVTLLDP